jgi:hypothetical protein
MAQVDTSIYNNLLRPPKSVAELDAEAMAGQQNKLAMMLNQQKAAEYTRGIQQEAQLADVYRSAVGADGKTDRNKLYTGAAQAGLGAKLPGIQKNYADLDESAAKTLKDQRLAEKAQFDLAREQMGFINQVIGAAKDQVTYTQGRQAMAARNMDVSQIPEQYDPAYVAQAGQQSMTELQRIEAGYKAKGFDLDVQKFDETVRNNKEQTAVQVRGQNMTSATAAAGRSVSMRGQDMSDDRARDFNGTRVEENRLKREQKNDVLDMTKASQVASFETMLGTLDRLSKHEGLSNSVGLVGKFPTLPGSKSANFQAELDTFQSQAFIPMVSQLKGMGALSDAEGKKLTAAVGALNPNMGEAAFRESIGRITTDMVAAKNRVSGKSGAPRPPAAPIQLKTAADYDNVPSGAEFITPDGKIMRKK